MNGEFYRCKSREGVVHIARDALWRETAPPVDEALCGEVNYFERTEEPVNCVGCIAAEGEIPED